MISVLGLGWIDGEGGRTHNPHGCNDRPVGLPGKEIFSYPFRNLGRLDQISRMTAYTVAMALKDAGIVYAQDHKLDMGIIGTNASGSLCSDIRYFRDYLETGRTTARGNLFIYTLPSSPLGEAAIHFGLQGPLLYMAGTENPLMMVMETAAEMMLLDDVPSMLAGIFGEDSAVCSVLVKDKECGGRKCLCDIDEVRQLVGGRMALAEIIRRFSKLKERKQPE
jgi:3-oxoacyl-[acyl-carrier-protein] synthase II